MPLVQELVFIQLQTLKSIGVFSIIILFFVKTMIIPMLVLDYELRKEYIINVYCINKNRPELHCDGKCYLAEKISQAKQKDEKQAMSTFFSLVFAMEGVEGLPEFSFPQNYFLFLIKEPIEFYYKSDFYKTPYFTFFIPPKHG